MDLRERVVTTVERGASRREAAEQFGLSPSVVILWMQRYQATGCVVPKPTGGSVSPLDDYAEFILGLIQEQPDMTLDEIVQAMAKAKIPGSRTAVWRFFERHGITVKKRLYTQTSKSVLIAPACAGGGTASRASLTPPIWCSSMRPARAPPWCGSMHAVREGNV
jgi:transposase